MNPQKADLQSYGEGFDKASVLAALGVIGAGAAVLFSLAVLMFPEWVPFHAFPAETDTAPVQVVTLRSLTAARTMHPPRVQMWTTMDAPPIHFSGSRQVTTIANALTTSAQRGQLGSAKAGVINTPWAEVDSAAQIRSQILKLPDGFDRITSAASTEVESALAKITNEVQTTSPVNPGGAAEVTKTVEGAAQDAQDRATQAAREAQDRATEASREAVDRAKELVKIK